MHHEISKIYDVFGGGVHPISRKNSKLQPSPQNEKRSDLIAPQLRVGSVENYCPNNTGED